MKKNVMLLNYVLSIGLIILVVIFLVSLITISRFVLSDVTPLGAHVINTKSLLEGINEVERTALLTNSTDSSQHNYLQLNDIGFQVTDISYLNVNKNKSIVTMFFDSPIGSINDQVYYVEVKTVDSLIKNELLIFEDVNTRFGKFVSVNDDGDLVVVNVETQKVDEINPSKLVGRIFYIAEK